MLPCTFAAYGMPRSTRKRVRTLACIDHHDDEWDDTNPTCDRGDVDIPVDIDFDELDDEEPCSPPQPQARKRKRTGNRGAPEHITIDDRFSALPATFQLTDSNPALTAKDVYQPDTITPDLIAVVQSQRRFPMKPCALHSAQCT